MAGGKWRFGSNGGSVAQGTSAFVTLLGTPGTLPGTTEAFSQAKFYTAYTVSLLRVNVTANSGTSTVAFRDDGASSSNLTLSITGTGWQEDATGSDTPAAKSLCCVIATAGGSHGNTITPETVLLTYEHASTAAPLVGGHILTGVANAFLAFGSAGTKVTTEDSSSQYTAQRATGVANLRAYVSAASSANFDLAIGVNGVSSSNVTVTITTTGAVEDVTGSETSATGDELNFRCIRTGGSATLSSVQAQIDTTTGLLGVSGYSSAPSATTREYEVFTGVLRNSWIADDNYTARMGSITAANLQCYCTSRDTGSLIQLRVASSDSTSLSISLSATGYAEDVSGSESVSDTWHLGWSLVSLGTGVTISRVAVEAPWFSAGTTATITGVTATAAADGQSGAVTTVRIANVTGVTTDAPAAGQAGTVQALGPSANITGVTATATADGNAGTVAAIRIANVIGVTATATADGQAGAVTAVRVANITGVTATADAEGQAGSVQIARAITGVTATADADGQAGTVAAIRTATIVGVTATADAAGQAGVVSTVRTAAVTGVSATADAAGQVGTVASVRIAAVVGVTATADAQGEVGAVQIAREITGVTATATADGQAGVVTAVGGGASATIAGVTATATADGQAGTVAAVRIVTVTGVTATADAQGEVGAVSTVRIASVTGITAEATAQGEVGSVTAARVVAISGVTAEATADGNAGAVQVARTITGVTATADAQGEVGAVAAVRISTIEGITATADALGIDGAVLAIRIVTIIGATAAATADGQAGVVYPNMFFANVVGVTATATAAGQAGFVDTIRHAPVIDSPSPTWRNSLYKPMSYAPRRYTPMRFKPPRYRKPF